MADKKFDLVFNASLEVGQVKSAVASLTKSLENAGAKIPQSMATNLNRMIQSLSTELNKLEGMTDIQLDPKNAKNVGKSYEKIFQTFQQIKAALGDIHRTAGIDPEKFFPSEIASNIAKAAQAVQKYKKAMETGVKTDEHTKATKDIAEAEKKIKSLNDKLDEAARKRQSSSIVKDQLQETRKKLQAEKDQAEAEDKAAKEAQKAIQDRIKSQERLAQVEEEIAKKKKKQQEAVNKAAKANEVKNERESMKQAKGKGTDTKIYRDAVASYAESTAEVQKLQSEIDQLEAEYTQLSQTATVTADEIVAANERATKAATELTNAQKRLNKNQTDIDAADTKYTAATAEVKTLVPEVQKAEDALNQLIQKKKQLEANFEQSTFDELIQELEKLGVKLPDTERNMEGVERALENLASEAKGKVVQAFNNVETAAEDVNNALKQTGQVTDDFDALIKETRRAEQDMENLKNQVLDFFSITNTIQIFKNTVREAFDTVKELDAVMTETAVVTDFTIGDMWEKLPIYSKQATALGASIKDLYGATTLYYQQGLQTNDAMSVGVETMKMARIANMDATEATTAMTAALRGFNMEVNEMNAQRVNDVYSELAAITAADTNQIATAMSKTASIASSANMEFETTAALLAQIIETTQEAPETAGTAMKTIIARFTEVKQLFSEGMLTGKDGEGEEININKIDAALKSVGISLKDFLNGTKGIDDIFLELASKWDNLDLATQRYIATTAAGSRQQSRFIAMMSNYDRTMELVGAANNSAGASQEQFNKTLESLDAKLQRLKNAWDQFVMGLANNEVIKLGVDTLTGILETVNKLTESLSGGNGLIKSIVSLASVIGALKGGASIFNSLFGYKKQIGEIDLGNGQKGSITLGKMSKKTQAEGEEAAAGLAFGLQKGIKQWQSNGLGAALKGFFGEEITTNVTEAYQQIDSKKLYNALGNMELGLAEDDLSQRAMDVRLLNEQIADGTIDIDIATKKYKEFGGSLEDVIVPAKAFSFNFQNIGVAAAGAGSAISLLGNLFEKLGAEDLGKALKGIGGAVTGIGSAFILLGPILNKTGLSIGKLGISFAKAGVAGAGAGTATVIGWAPILGTLLPIIAALGLLAGAFIAIRNASPEYQLKQAAEAAEEAAEAADKAAESYNNLKSSLESIEQKEDALDGLIVGTNEWKDAVSELNNQILDLLAIYPELAQFISSEGGILTISTEGEDFIINKERQNKTNAEALNIGEQIDKIVAQKAVDYGSLDRRLIQYEWENIYEIDQYGRQYVADVKQVENKQLTEELAKGLASGTIARDDERLAFLDSYEGAYEDFLAFGRALLASDQTISAFTDSLLTAATANADVSEEFKSQIGGMYNEEIIDELITKYETASGLPTEEDKRQYASMKGYTYEGGNKFKDSEGKEKTVGLQEIKEQLAPVKAQQEMTKAIAGMESVFSKLQNSSNGLERAFANVISKTEGAGVTLEDFSNYKNLFMDPYQEALNDDGSFKQDALNQLYIQVSDIFTQEEFYQIIADSYKKIGESIEGAREKMFSMGLGEELFSDAKIEAGALVGITEQLYDIFLISGREASNGIADTLSDSFDKIKNQDQQKIFAEALEMIDWSNIDSVNDLSEILLELGFDADAAGIDIGLLEEEIKLAAKASRTFNLEKIREEIKSVDGLVKDLREREETERTITAEQRELILAADPSLEDKFVASSIDEFVYIGDSINDLIIALNNNTAAQLGDYGSQLGSKALNAKKWQEIYENGRTWYYDDGRQAGTDYSVLADIAQKGSLEGYNLEAVKVLMEQLGMDAVGTTEQLVARIKQEYENYGSAAARERIFADYENYNKIEEQIALSKLSSAQEVLDTQALEENKDKVLQGQLDTEGLAKEYETVEKALADSNSELAEYKTLIKAAIIDSNAYEKKLSRLAEVYKENRDALKETNKDTVTYQRALAEVTTAAQQAFGESINEDFVKDNLPLFDQWYQGIDGAAEKIREALADSFADSLTGTDEEVAGKLEAIKNAATDLDGLDFDIYGHADATEVFTTLAAVLGSADEAKRALQSLGYSVELKKAPVYDYTHGPNGILVGYEYRAVVTDGLGNSISTNRSNYSGGGGGGSSDKWSNPYDKQYNNNEKLNEELRTRNKLEREYQKLLDLTNTKTSDLVNKSREQLESLERERAIRKEILSGRQKEMAAVEKKYSDLSEYASYNEEKQIIEINWKKINELDGSKDEKLTSRIEEYIAALEKTQGQIDEQTDAIANIDENVKEIRDRGKDEYRDLENQIRDAIESSRQKEIDELVAINKSINDTNASLIESIQTTLDKQRQERENERTEEELSNKQRRLAYLQQDTSGANQMEILRLQKEIKEGQEDYTDSLIDQKINELQQQNDMAAEQRQYQIDLMQSQLDQYMESGRVWQDVYQLMTQGIGPNGIIAGSELENLLMEGANFGAMSEIEKMNWLKELEDNVAKAVEWLKIGNSTSSLKDQGDLKKGDKVTFTTADNKTLTGKVNSKGQVVVDGQVYEGVYRNFDGNYVTDENYKKPKKEPSPDKPTTPAPEPEAEKPKKPKLTDKIKKGVSAAIWNGNYGWGNGDTRVKRLKEVFGENDIQKNYVAKSITSGYDGKVSDYSYTNMKKKFLQYKTGGLADFTGPAWLDGTKSRPEYVLNADQTKSFFRLVDVLSGLKSGPINNSQNNGDITYDIDINVESIGSDYDVEQLADKVKGLINDTARYRNNNIISIKR